MHQTFVGYGFQFTYGATMNAYECCMARTKRDTFFCRSGFQAGIHPRHQIQQISIKRSGYFDLKASPTCGLSTSKQQDDHDQ